MSPEEHELLRRSIALSEENNDILRGLQRSMRLSRFMSVLYWLIIIGISIGAWYFLQPYWNQAMTVYKQAQVQLQSISGAASKINSIDTGAINNASGAVNDVINSVKKTIGQ